MSVFEALYAFEKTFGCVTSWIRILTLLDPSVLPREAECFTSRGRVFYLAGSSVFLCMHLALLLSNSWIESNTAVDYGLAAVFNLYFAGLLV